MIASGEPSGARVTPPGESPPTPPGPRWLGTAVLVVAVVEVGIGAASLAVGVPWVGILLVASGLMIATVMIGLRRAP